MILENKKQYFLGLGASTISCSDKTSRSFFFNSPLLDGLFAGLFGVGGRGFPCMISLSGLWDCGLAGVVVVVVVVATLGGAAAAGFGAGCLCGRAIWVLERTSFVLSKLWISSCMSRRVKRMKSNSFFEETTSVVSSKSDMDFNHLVVLFIDTIMSDWWFFTITCWITTRNQLFTSYFFRLVRIKHNLWVASLRIIVFFLNRRIGAFVCVRRADIRIKIRVFEQWLGLVVFFRRNVLSKIVSTRNKQKSAKKWKQRIKLFKQNSLIIHSTTKYIIVLHDNPHEFIRLMNHCASCWRWWTILITVFVFAAKLAAKTKTVINIVLHYWISIKKTYTKPVIYLFNRFAGGTTVFNPTFVSFVGFVTDGILLSIDKNRVVSSSTFRVVSGVGGGLSAMIGDASFAGGVVNFSSSCGCVSDIFASGGVVGTTAGALWPFSLGTSLGTTETWLGWLEGTKIYA